MIEMLGTTKLPPPCIDTRGFSKMPVNKFSIFCDYFNSVIFKVIRDVNEDTQQEHSYKRTATYYLIYIVLNKC